MKPKKLFYVFSLGAMLINSGALRAQAWWERTYGLPSNNERSGQGYYDPTLRRMVMAGTCDFGTITNGVLHAPNVVVTNRAGHPIPLPGPSIYNEYFILKDAANTPMDAEANGCIKLSTGEIGLVGNVRPSGSNNKGDVLYMRVDPNTGAVNGAYSFDIGGEEFATKLYQDNNFIYITGYQYTYTGFHAHKRLFVMKADLNGVLFWSKWYELYDVFIDDRETSGNDLIVYDGNIYVVGTSFGYPNPFNSAHDAALFVKIDEASGTLLTAQFYTNLENSGFNKIIRSQSPLLPGEFIVTGFIETTVNDKVFWTANINTTGIIFNQCFQGSPWTARAGRRNTSYDVKERFNSSTNQYEYYAVGDAENIGSSTSSPPDVMLVIMDQVLNPTKVIRYTTNIANGSDDHGRAIDFTGTTLSQNGYVLFGHVPYQTNPNPNNMNLYMVKSDYPGTPTCNFSEYSANMEYTSTMTAGLFTYEDYVFNPITVSATVTYADVYETLCEIFAPAKNDLSTGNREIGKNAAISFYPNPAYNSLTIDAPAGSYDYMILDIQGKQVLSGTTTAGEAIGIQTLQPGMYLLQLRGENGLNESFKFIRQ